MSQHNSSQSQLIDRYMSHGVPYMYSIDYTTITGASNDTLTVGGKTYTYNTDFSVPKFGGNGAVFDPTDYVKSLAACVNSELGVLGSMHTNKVPNAYAYCRSVGKLLIIVARQPGTALAGLAATINGGAASITTEFTGSIV